jgi:hypothetical protein
MVLAALFDNAEDIIKTMYDVDKKWGKHFP